MIKRFVWTALSSGTMWGATVIFMAITACASGFPRLEERQKVNDSGEVVARWHVKVLSNGEELRNGHYWSYDWPVEEEGEYSDGVRIGEWRETLRSNGMRSISSYEKGALHGKFRVFDAENRLIVEGQYANGKRDGPWTYWDSEGDVVRSELYENGVQK